jgi:hypothetical protein
VLDLRFGFVRTSDPSIRRCPSEAMGNPMNRRNR